MPVLLSLWSHYRRRLTWQTPLLVLGLVFVTSWALMALAEDSTDIAEPRQYWWWFLVTASTVGYGDVYPETTGGRLVAAYVVAGGVATLTTVFTHVADRISRAKGRRMRGLTDHDLSGHVVLLGYTAGRTDRLVQDLLADAAAGGRALDVVLCAWEDQAEVDPLPDDVRTHFVRGDLTDLDVLRRAAPARAAAILVDARDDNEAVTLTIAAEEVSSGVHTVVTLRDLARRRTIARVDRTVHCVQWHATQMVLEELQDPGIAGVYDELMTPGGMSTWSSTVPDGSPATYGAWQRALGEAHGATLLALRASADRDDVVVSPGWDTTVPAGSVLYYVGPRRLTAAELRDVLAGRTDGDVVR
ncbi:ion channel [Nocardioides deserti]|uniref:NAD-binding protein n=1 Tax=Nocardioides deserti TaxID=1588644 RepID=A0ABR6UFB5_9ACTN|nr:ion channel [Nocardioides deserti]MBC2962501.1 NAD-binding protein [Nocardioides deserti]GGO72752.1 potassium channel protein [Nocardioides deserti]